MDGSLGRLWIIIVSGSSSLDHVGSRGALLPHSSSSSSFAPSPQMCYWGAPSANLAECAQPLVPFVRSLARGAGRAAAARWYRSRGWVAHGYTDIWCGGAPAAPRRLPAALALALGRCVCVCVCVFSCSGRSRGGASPGTRGSGVARLPAVFCLVASSPASILRCDSLASSYSFRHGPFVSSRYVLDDPGDAPRGDGGGSPGLRRRGTEERLAQQRGFDSQRSLDPGMSGIKEGRPLLRTDGHH